MTELVCNWKCVLGRRVQGCGRGQIRISVRFSLIFTMLGADEQFIISDQPGPGIRIVLVGFPETLLFVPMLA